MTQNSYRIKAGWMFLVVMACSGPLIAAEDVTDRWGVGGAVGVADLLSPSEVRKQNDVGLNAGAWLRYGFAERSEAMVAWENAQGQGKGDSSRSAIRSLTLSWLQNFGDGPWVPTLSLGAGPGWVRRVSSEEKERPTVALRAGATLERMLGDSFSWGVGTEYLYSVKEGRYTPAASALTANLVANWYFRSGGVRPLRVATPARAPASPPPPSVDTDGDGVPDERDACPDTPAGVAVDALGCPKDTDLDGVLDTFDKCPDTPAGVLVNEEGCPSEKVTVTLDIKFDKGEAVVKPEFEPQLKRVADFMSRFPATTVVIEGHTDITGTLAINKLISQKRADAVRIYLVQQFHVDSKRITAKGFGPTQPIADNRTEKGRAANRRVVATITAIKF